MKLFGKKPRIKDIYVRYHADIDPIEINDRGDWIDLRAGEDTFIPKGQAKKVNLGVAIKLPKGYEAHFQPRSSTYGSWNVMQTNSMAVIDNIYCGDNDIWKVQMIALFEDADIKKNDRIVQFRIVKKQPKIRINTVDHLDGPDRGGYGTSGKN